MQQLKSHKKIFELFLHPTETSSLHASSQISSTQKSDRSSDNRGQRSTPRTQNTNRATKATNYRVSTFSHGLFFFFSISFGPPSIHLSQLSRARRLLHCYKIFVLLRLNAMVILFSSLILFPCALSLLRAQDDDGFIDFVIFIFLFCRSASCQFSFNGHSSCDFNTFLKRLKSVMMMEIMMLERFFRRLFLLLL